MLGFVLATHRLVPRGNELLDLANAVVVAGPLLWACVLSFNDAHDADTDARNPRKADAPVVTGRVTPRQASRFGVVAGLAAVLVAVPLGALFVLGTALTLVLGWAYSAPPFRLKARAGADVLVNASAVGVLGPLGGWVATTGGPSGFPWVIAAIGLMAASALYLPTTVTDRSADIAAGIRTTAVALGERATFELGFALWTGSAALALALAAADVVLDPSLVPLHLMVAPFLLALYRALLRGTPTFRAITVVAAAYLVPCTAFVITYVETLW